MKTILLTIMFYLENSLFFNKEKGNRSTIISTLFGLYLVIQSIIKLNKSFDWFNFSYLIVGILITIFYLYKGFYNSFQKHKNIKTLFGYKSIEEFYMRQK